MTLDASDIADSVLVTEEELQSTGSVSYRSVSVTGIVSGTVSCPANTTLINYDDPIQSGDIVVISGNAAAGTYTVDTATLDTFTVVEAIVDAGAGTADFRHPPGANRVGIDVSPFNHIASSTLSGALGDLDTTLGPGLVPVDECSLIYSEDGITFKQVVPIVGRGVLVNDLGILVVKG